MKKFLFTLILASSMVGARAATGQGQAEKEGRRQAKEKQLKAYVEAVLKTTFGEGAASEWQVNKRGRGLGQSAYSHAGNRKSLFFTPDNAHRLASVEQVAPEALSGRLVRKLARKYKGYEIAQVIRYHDGQTLFFVSLKKGLQEVLVSYSGK